MRKLMILGAGIFQVAAIKKAVTLGYYVITVDNIPTNIGHKYSHESINISTIDSDAVVKAAEEYKIDGVYTIASDIALPTVARVAEALMLPGPDVKALQSVIDKNSFRSLQADLELNAPRFLKVYDIDLAINSWTGGSAIVKPAMSSGSRGVAMLEVVNADARPYFELAQGYSSDGCACLEDYISGDDISVEGFILDGRVSHAFISKKYTREFSVIGHELPNNLSIELNEQVIGQIQRLIDSGVISDGPFDADFRLRGRDVVLLEITPRLGGNGLPVLVEAAYGVSLIEMSIRYAMKDIEILSGVGNIWKVVPHASILLFSEETGEVKSVATNSIVKSRMPALQTLCINLIAGQKVERFLHGGQVFGFGIVRKIPGTDFISSSRQLQKALSIQIDQRVLR